MKCCAYSFQVGTFRTGFWVYNDRTAPEQHRIVDNEVVAKGLAAPK